MTQAAIDIEKYLEEIRARRAEKGEPVALAPSGPQLLSSGDFIRGFRPPDYLINGMLQRRFIYSITGRTGEGKTAVCLRMAAHVAEGKAINKAKVARGRVLYLAGENPDDIAG